MNCATSSREAATPPGRVALDTSCVINLLSPSERPSESLLGLVRLSTQGRTQLSVTPIVEEEIPAVAGAGEEVKKQHRQFLRDRLHMFAVDLEDSANLPEPAVIAAEIAEDLEAALGQIRELLEDLSSER